MSKWASIQWVSIQLVSEWVSIQLVSEWLSEWYMHRLLYIHSEWDCELIIIKWDIDSEWASSSSTSICKLVAVASIIIIHMDYWIKIKFTLTADLPFVEELCYSRLGLTFVFLSCYTHATRSHFTYIAIWRSIALLTAKPYIQPIRIKVEIINQWKASDLLRDYCVALETAKQHGR